MLSLILATIIAAGSVQAMSMSMPVFAGCVEQKNTNSGSYQLIKNQMSAMQCASSCFAMDTKYIWSYYAGAGNVCGCAETGITPEMYGTALDSSGDCPQTSYAAYVTASTYSFEGCFASWSSMPINKALAHFGLTLEQCFQVCGAEAGAVFMTDNKQYETIGTCGCPESGQSFAPAGNAVTCDQNSIYLYTHMPGATTPGSPGPSSYIKKREKERLEREANEVKAVCPVDLTPCNVIDGDGLSFECLDVNQELESCGGCINGGFGFQDGVVGVDCTALAGVDPSAVSCVQGQCKVSACKSGYKLVGGKCIGKDQIKIGSKGSINVDKKVRAEPKPVALAVPESRWVDPLELK